MTTQKIKLLITASELMYNSQVRNICDIIQRLDRQIFDVEVGALSVGDEATNEVAALDVPIFWLQTLPARSRNLRRQWSFLTSPLLVTRKRFDLVHSLLWQSQPFEAMILKTFSNARYIYTKSELVWDNHPVFWRIRSMLADRIISTSSATDAVLARHGFAEKTRKAPLGIDTDYFKSSTELGLQARAQWGIPHDAFTFGCAAQFLELKEHLTVLNAFEYLSEDHPNAYLIFCGPDHADSYYADFLRKYEDSPAKGRIRIVGTVSHMPTFYSAIDCFVMVSRADSFGYVYIEAMSCEKPVIACNIGGPADIVVPGETGLFAEMSNPRHLSLQMCQYLQDRAMLEQHGIAARKRAVNVFSSDAMVNRLQEIYLETYGS